MLRKNERGHGQSTRVCNIAHNYASFLIFPAIVTLQRKTNSYGIAIPDNFLIYSENLDLKETIGQGKEDREQSR